MPLLTDGGVVRRRYGRGISGEKADGSRVGRWTECGEGGGLIAGRKEAGAWGGRRPERGVGRRSAREEEFDRSAGEGGGRRAGYGSCRREARAT